MSSFRVRPRFSHTVNLNVSDARDRLLQSLPQHSSLIEVRSFPDFVGLHIADGHRHYWSPQLLLSFAPLDDGTTRIDGCYGPEAEVWSVFLYGYLMTGLLGMFSAILGSAQLVISTYPWAFYITGGMAALAAGLYFAAQFGQKLGAWQTFQLHQAYETAMGQSPEIR